MNIKIAAAILVLCMIMTSCGVKSIEKSSSQEESEHYDNNGLAIVDKPEASSHEEMPPEADPDEIFDVTVIKEGLEVLGEKGYGWNNENLPPDRISWIDENKIIFHTYDRSSEGMLSSRICLYDTAKGKLIETAEWQSDENPQVATFRDSDGYNILIREGKKYRIITLNTDTGTSVSSEAEAPVNPVSSIGYTARVNLSKSKVRIAEYKNPENTISEFKIARNFWFESWSPEGKYIAFVNKNTNERKIYDLDGHLLDSFKLKNNQYSWCSDEGYMAFPYRIDDEDFCAVKDFITQTVSILPVDPLMEWESVLTERDFSIIELRDGSDDIRILDHSTAAILDPHIENPDEVTSMAYDYNSGTKTLALAVEYGGKDHRIELYQIKFKINKATEPSEEPRLF